MSVAGWHKTFMAPFHTLISCDIPFVLFRLGFEHDMSHRILSRVSIHFAASEYSNLRRKTWQLLLTWWDHNVVFQILYFYKSPVDSFYVLPYFWKRIREQFIIGLWITMPHSVHIRQHRLDFVSFTVAACIMSFGVINEQNCFMAIVNFYILTLIAEDFLNWFSTKKY